MITFSAAMQFAAVYALSRIALAAGSAVPLLT